MRKFHSLASLHRFAPIQDSYTETDADSKSDSRSHSRPRAPQSLHGNLATVGGRVGAQCGAHRLLVDEDLADLGAGLLAQTHKLDRLCNSGDRSGSSG